MLCYGGNWLVSGGVGVARRFGTSPLIIGMTVVAYGTSTPELAASIAAAGEHGQIILGNVVGSNIANVGMVIGIAAAITSIAVQKSILKRHVPVMLGFSALLAILSLDGEISMYDGAILVGLLVAFTLFVYRDAKNSDSGPVDVDNGSSSLARSGGLIGLGIVLLGAGAWLTVEHAVILAASFGLSERIIGITIIAIGTSLPELITSIIAIRRGHTDIGIGNIIGSNVYNILMILGVASVIAVIPVPDQIIYDYIIMIGFSAVLFVGMRSGFIGRLVGLALAGAYFAYLAFALLVR